MTERGQPDQEWRALAGLIDAHDAAVVERRDDGKVRVTRKHETPAWPGGGSATT